MQRCIPIFLILILLQPHGILLAKSEHSKPSIKPLQTYIVHVKQPTDLADSISSGDDLEMWYKSFLPPRLLLGSGEPQWVYAYHHVTSGFAVQLTEEELSAMEKKDGFLLAYPDRLIPLQTTYTPSFLGLEHHGNHHAWDVSNYGSGVIIGVLDTGISPNHTSFNDEGMPQPPAKWKGKCEFTSPEGCNKKLIGARNFISGLNAMRGVKSAKVESQPPFDTEGHGTHTASTAAGKFVRGASVYGNAPGVAVGMAPRAHLAIYKVCAENGCPTSDILAGLDAAVGDGVDVLSLSLGGASLPFFQDAIAIGAFGAIKKGVFVSCAAGNSGPYDSTLSNEAPWILTVGASTTDRLLRTTVVLGDGQPVDGESLNQAIPFPTTTPIPLVYHGESSETATCSSLEGVDVQGKAVVCDMGGNIGRVAKGSVVQAAGGVAVILANTADMGYSTLAEPHVLPASHVSYVGAEQIKAYINSTSDPTVTISPKGTVYQNLPPAPMVSYFSSRGPSQASPNILKPDIIGPGVNVLAAWPFQVGPIKASDTFHLISGTSMATPHLSGIVGLLKAAHPEWSPAMIRSAIMTSADITGKDGYPIFDQLLRPYNLFATGAGHVNPTAALNPGLVFDIEPNDYIKYLCGLGYNDRQISAIARKSITCSSYPVHADLNYPSITVSLNSEGRVNTTRVLKNVGPHDSIYRVRVMEPPGVKVVVRPSVLRFSASTKVVKITVIFQGKSGAGSSYEAGFLTLTSKHNVVRSPLLLVPSSVRSSVVDANQPTHSAW